MRDVRGHTCSKYIPTCTYKKIHALSHIHSVIFIRYMYQHEHVHVQTRIRTRTRTCTRSLSLHTLSLSTSHTQTQLYAQISIISRNLNPSPLSCHPQYKLSTKNFTFLYFFSFLGAANPPSVSIL